MSRPSDQAEEAAFGPCHSCHSSRGHLVVDLGLSPPCESFPSPDQLDQPETFFPLRVFVCVSCFLVQLRAYVDPAAIFSEYAYFSSLSESWLRHAKTFVDGAIQSFKLTNRSWVVELASNDGYLLQYLAQGIPCLGIEPAANVAEAARAKGVETLVRFFGEECARDLVQEGRLANLIVGNNVLAQVPYLNDFAAGIKILLAPGGVASLEFPHVVRLIEGNQFDTIYHEHYSYFSLWTVEHLFARHGLAVFDVEELKSPGGSLRVIAQHLGGARPEADRLRQVRLLEERVGVTSISYYRSFAGRVAETKRTLLAFLIDAKNQGKTIAGYGAPGKGNTLLNYCGIRTDFLDFTVDRKPYKHGRLLPGTRIPIFPPEHLMEAKPDLVVILPWNLATEIAEQLAPIQAWGGRCLVPIPEVSYVL